MYVYIFDVDIFSNMHVWKEPLEHKLFYFLHSSNTKQMGILKINLSNPSSKKRRNGEDWVVLNSVSCSECNPFCLRVEIQISR